MTHALPTLSVEQNIRNKLAALGCSENSFARFNGAVKRTRFFEGLSGRPGTHFDQQIAERLLAIIAEMECLQAETPVPIRWNQTQQIDDVLFARRLQKASHDVNGDSKLFDELVSQATSEL